MSEWVSTNVCTHTSDITPPPPIFPRFVKPTSNQFGPLTDDNISILSNMSTVRSGQEPICQPAFDQVESAAIGIVIPEPAPVVVQAPAPVVLLTPAPVQQQPVQVTSNPVTERHFILVTPPVNPVQDNLPDNNNNSMTQIKLEQLIDPKKVETHTITDPDFTDVFNEHKIIGNILTTQPFPVSETGMTTFVDTPAITRR